MSYFESQSTSSHVDGYLSDSSWFSDFDDSPDDSEICDLPQSEIYSQEIKDNQINENLEAQLANTYENTQPSNSVQEISSAHDSPVVSESKISTRNLGAIPKTAFSYLHNQTDVSNLKKKLTNQRTTRDIGNSEDINSASNPKSYNPLYPPTGCNAVQILESSNEPLSITHQEKSQNNKTLSKPVVAQKPGKLKAEAFSFLSKVHNKESSSETTNKNFKEDKKHFVPTAIVNAVNFKPSQTPFPDPQDNIKTNKLNMFDPAPAGPPFENLQKNTVHRDNMTPNLMSNATKNAVILQRSSSEGTKPPLPSRPPPVFKYPSGIFSQQISGTSQEAKSAQQNFAQPLPSREPFIEMITNETNFQVRTDTSACLENVPNDNTRIIQQGPQRGVPAENIIQNDSTCISSLYDTCVDVQINNEDKRSFRKSLNDIETPISQQISMFSRPLPPVPAPQVLKASNSRIREGSVISNPDNLKTKTETMNQLLTTPPTNITRFLNNKTLLDAEMQENDHTLREGHEQTFKPKPPLRSKRLEDIIGNQTHVSNETFESQQKISAAIAARLQNKPLKKVEDVSYEDPRKEHDTQEDTNPIRSLYMLMETSQCDVPPRQASNCNVKGNVNPRTLSDINELQNAMTRPCLPQKLKTTQRSLSCTSIVQTIKDMGFSKRSPSDKDKRNSEGTGSFEETSRNFTREIKLIEESQLHGATSISNIADISRKAIPTKEPKFSINRSSEKSMMSRYPWFHDVDFKEAQRRLLALGEDGTFLIRPSSKPTNETQYTTCVVYRGRVLNLRIRRNCNGQYALGIHKDFEKTFSSLSDMIKYYQDVAIEFHPDSGSASNQEPIYVCLRITPPK